MARHLLRASTALASSKPTARGEPGSNGFWRRDVYSRPGTYTWTAKKDGKIKVQAIGAACGGKGNRAGPSGSYGEKVLSVTAGQTLTLVVPAGSDGTISAGTPASAGTLSVSGTPVGGSPLVLIGATNVDRGLASGPWDLSYQGANPITAITGSPSSASPFGPGIACPDAGFGGAGWGGASSTNAYAGASTHASASGKVGAPGLTTLPIAISSSTTVSSDPIASPANPTARPIWDMSDADSAGGTSATTNDNSGFIRGNSAGPGAGGAHSFESSALNARGGVSSLGGGTGYSGFSQNGNIAPKSGFGAGGGAAGGGANAVGGAGGDGIIFLFWDEVA